MKLSDITDEKMEQLSDWYWQFGLKRKGLHALPRGVWFDKLSRTLKQYRGICTAEEKFKKPAIAIWGPSQSGKSTLLATFIDHGSGALSWTGEKFYFVHRDKMCLNPNNRGSDASGCVTRYVMREQVEYPETPVEIQFAEERDILMSMAFGYISETDGCGKDGEKKYWNAESLRKMLETFKADNSAKNPDKNIFSVAYDVVDVLEALMLAKQERYSNLEKDWASLRGEILNCDGLLSDEATLQEFAANLFWDGWKNLSDIYKELIRKSRLLKSDFPGKVFCSLEVASIFLDISAAENRDSNNKVFDFRISTLAGSAFSISRKGQKAAFKDEWDFALTQALVAVLIVPLKKSAIAEANGELCKLMEEADLIDFPGVARGEKGEDIISDGAMGENRLLGLTQVLKRGKTASIVIGYARNLDIDVFAILMRANDIAHKPKQLRAGIAAWFEEMIQKTLTRENVNELPINIVQTFAATFIRTVKQKRLDGNGLEKVFDKNDAYGELCEPGRVKYFAINYPKFDDGVIDVEGEELEKYVREIEQDPHFRGRYDGTEKSLREMCGLGSTEKEDGGRSYLFANLLTQIRNSRRKNILDEKKRKLSEDFRSLVERALPDDAAGERKRSEDIRKILDAIERYSSINSEKIRDAIFRFTNIVPENLKFLPPSSEYGISGTGILKDYCEKVLAQIREMLEQKSSDLSSAILLKELDLIRVRLVSYMLEAKELQPAELEKWIKFNIPKISDGIEREALRRQLTVYLRQKLLRQKSNCHREINLDSDDGDDDFRYFVAPFQRALTTIGGENAKERGRQAGDDELVRILSSEK